MVVDGGGREIERVIENWGTLVQFVDCGFAFADDGNERRMTKKIDSRGALWAIGESHFVQSRGNFRCSSTQMNWTDRQLNRK